RPIPRSRIVSKTFQAAPMLYLDVTGMPGWFMKSVGSPGLDVEQARERADRRRARSLRDRPRQGDVLRADLDAVLRVAAVDDAALLHQRVEALVRVHRAGGVRVEEDDLPDRRGADERALLVDLRTRVEAAAARHALGEV